VLRRKHASIVGSCAVWQFRVESITEPKNLAARFATTAKPTKPQALNPFIFLELGTMEIFDYDNILLLPRKCRVESRSECDASVDLRAA
jgi:hypothetical protein